MQKKIISVVLAILMVVAIVPVSAFAEDDILDYLEYEIVDGEVTITDCDESICGDVVIPDTIEGYPVISIGYKAFFYITGVSTITIPASVSHIDSRAFAYAYLDKIYVSAENDFYSNDENGVLYNKDKTRLVYFPTNAYGNEYRYNLDTYNIPDGVTDIGEYAFYYCPNLRYIKIPATVTTIEKYAFFDDSSTLSSISVDENNKYYASEMGSLLNKDKTVLIKGTSSSGIPEGTIIIEEYAFYNSGFQHKDITIPDSVTTIKDYAFQFGDYESISIGSGLSYIGKDAFYYCLSLKKIEVSEENKYYSNDENGILFNKDKTELIQFPMNCGLESYSMPNSVIAINDNAFYGCDLTELTFSENVKTIGDYAFSSCHGLKSIIIPDSVESIGYEAFSYNNFNNIYIGSGVKSIDSFAFFSSDSLTFITVSEDNNNYINDENGILFTKDKATLVMYPPARSETEYVIPDTVTEIGASAFFYCFNLTSITMPNTVKKIGEWAFAVCESLSNINIPYGIEKIPFYAFCACPLLNITLPASVYEIEAAFFGCESVTILNPECSFPGSTYDEDFYPSLYGVTTIYGYENSTAQVYAEKYNVNFVVIEKTECNHKSTEIINITDYDCINDGYTGDIYCNDCEEIIEYGEVVTATDHSDSDNNSICDVCETELEIVQPEPEVPAEPGTPEEPEDTEKSQSFFDKLVEFFKKIIEFIKNLFV